MSLAPNVDGTLPNKEGGGGGPPGAGPDALKGNAGEGDPEEDCAGAEEKGLGAGVVEEKPKLEVDGAGAEEKPKFEVGGTGAVADDVAAGAGVCDDCM